jgi:glutathione S-transferase
VDTLLMPLELRLQTHRHLLGERISLADMALLPFVRQFAQIDRAWWHEASNLPALARWLDRSTGSALFQAVMARD